MNGAETLVRTLLASGVNTCFANPGTSEMHFFAALVPPSLRQVAASAGTSRSRYGDIFVFVVMVTGHFCRCGQTSVSAFARAPVSLGRLPSAVGRLFSD